MPKIDWKKSEKPPPPNRSFRSVYVDARAAGEAAVLFPVEIARRAAPLPLRVIGAQPVVMRAFFGIAQDFIRLVDFLEAFLGSLVFGVVIWMVLLGEVAIRLADIFLAGFAVHTQDLVIVLVIHNLIIVITVNSASQARRWMSNATLIRCIRMKNRFFPNPGLILPSDLFH